LRFYPNPNFSPDFKGIDSIPSSTTLSGSTLSLT